MMMIKKKTKRRTRARKMKMKMGDVAAKSITVSKKTLRKLGYFFLCPAICSN